MLRMDSLIKDTLQLHVYRKASEGSRICHLAMHASLNVRPDSFDNCATHAVIFIMSHRHRPTRSPVIFAARRLIVLGRKIRIALI